VKSKSVKRLVEDCLAVCWCPLVCSSVTKQLLRSYSITAQVLELCRLRKEMPWFGVYSQWKRRARLIKMLFIGKTSSGTSVPLSWAPWTSVFSFVSCWLQEKQLARLAQQVCPWSVPCPKRAGGGCWWAGRNSEEIVIKVQMRIKNCVWWELASAWNRAMNSRGCRQREDTTQYLRWGGKAEVGSSFPAWLVWSLGFCFARCRVRTAFWFRQ